MIIKGADCFSVGENAPNLPEHLRKSEELLIRRLMRP
jgi:hypothetical protein